MYNSYSSEKKYEFLQKNVNFCKKIENSYSFQIFFQRGTLWCQNGKFWFFNFLKFHISFFKNGFTGTKGILKWRNSWILVNLVIKLWKWETTFGRPGPKWPPLVGIGLIRTFYYLYYFGNCWISLCINWWIMLVFHPFRHVNFVQLVCPLLGHDLTMCSC